jgi:thiamine biosynthesis protein ThiS
MQITVNGETTEVREGETVLGLLRLLEMKPERVAVEVDRSIVKQAEWPATVLRPGAEVEIVQFVGGG